MSAAPPATSREASLRKPWSKAPIAPALRSAATVPSGISTSFGATMGTLSARMRSGSAARQRIQGSRMKSGPWRASQFSPGR
ncbi:hypothetical protein ACFFMN_12765 [Planobispora siamensis]|uniref:Uncharacterized protein n=1 Tax=Planobispora siamensis TaxID=936338 RepID=A0A8J3SBM4_9ACTN|nr:hypothetical protein Psi01_04020 [Planobispora siamensis]